MSGRRRLTSELRAAVSLVLRKDPDLEPPDRDGLRPLAVAGAAEVEGAIPAQILQDYVVAAGMLD